MTDAMIVINADSTSLEFGAYAAGGADSPPLPCRDEIDGMQYKDNGAVAAIEYFVYAMTKCAGAHAAVLGELEAFLFTTDIGEHSAPVHTAVCAKLAWLGLSWMARRTPPTVCAFPRLTAGSRCGSSRQTRN